MARPGSFKIARRNRAFESQLDPNVREARRVQRLVESLRGEIQDDATTVRARRIFAQPREVFRFEIDNPQMGYRRTTVLERPLLDAIRADYEVGRRLRLEID